MTIEQSSIIKHNDILSVSEADDRVVSGIIRIARTHFDESLTELPDDIKNRIIKSVDELYDTEKISMHQRALVLGHFCIIHLNNTR